MTDELTFEQGINFAVRPVNSYPEHILFDGTIRPTIRNSSMLTQANHQLPILPMDRPQPAVNMQKWPVAIMPKIADYAIETPEMTSLDQQKKKILDRYINQRTHTANYLERQLIKVQNLERRAFQLAAENKRLIESIKKIKEQHLGLERSDFVAKEAY